MAKPPSHVRHAAALRLKLAKARVVAESGDGYETGEPETFRQYVDRVRPGYEWYPHCATLAAVLQRVADGELDRVMVFEPPRHGKSELVSRLFPGYYLKRHPDRWVGLNSYGADLAYTLSRAARAFYVKAGGAVAQDSAAVKHWETGRGGGLWAAGVGGPITGKGFHLGIIDDPLKNAEEAASEVIRAKQKEWYGSTFYTREEPGGAIVVVQTRWHEDDLSGHLIEREKSADDEPEGWHVVSMEAIKEAEPPTFPPSCTVEPDTRQVGEPLCPARYSLAKLNRIARTVGSYIFAALFQQRPAPAGGGMFTTFPIAHETPKGCKWVRYWDKAGTANGGAYTAGVKMALTPTGEFIITHIVRGQWSAGEREKVIKDTAHSDGKECHVWVEQEPGSGGKESAENTVKNLAGFHAYIERVTGVKETRARPMAAQAEIGNVKLLKADWNQGFVDEARSFPNGRYKDQIDAAGGAFNKLALALRPTRTEAAKAEPLPAVPRVASPLPAGIPHPFGQGARF